MATSLATIKGTLSQDAFHFNLVLGYQGLTLSSPFILDTGAFEMALTEATASALGLPNLGALTISGVTGSAQAYKSEVDVDLGSTLYTNVHCIVDPSLQSDQLFGLRFFIDHQLELSLNTVTQTLTVAKAGTTSSSPAPSPAPSQEAYAIEFVGAANADEFIAWAAQQGWTVLKKPVGAA